MAFTSDLGGLGSMKTIERIIALATIMDKFIGTIQRFMFQLTLSHTFWVLLQPPLPHSMLFGENKLKTVRRTESGPVYGNID